MFSCTTDKYDDLYARWLDDPGMLLDLGQYKPGESMLDLAGGTGIISKEAIRRGAHPSTVNLLDLNPRFKGGTAGDANWPQAVFGPEQFDFVVCRQAMAYLDIYKVARGVERVLAPGGRFVFNTFQRPKWAASFYRFEGSAFFEASGWLGRRVGHVQVRFPFDVDVTLFRWWTETEICKAFAPHFDVTAHASGKSIRWVCTKPQEVKEMTFRRIRQPIPVPAAEGVN